jgi:hypothetical protein
VAPNPLQWLQDEMNAACGEGKGFTVEVPANVLEVLARENGTPPGLTPEQAAKLRIQETLVYLADNLDEMGRVLDAVIDAKCPDDLKMAAINSSQGKYDSFPIR